ncbi:hypothetical protein L1887_60662 [Cichorium endivia]|nr:hypothetical protein L1887_60662 [Cichorium endivia]
MSPSSTILIRTPHWRPRCRSASLHAGSLSNLQELARLHQLQLTFQFGNDNDIEVCGFTAIPLRFGDSHRRNPLRARPTQDTDHDLHDLHGAARLMLHLSSGSKAD